MPESNNSIDAQEWVVQFDGVIKHTITKISYQSDSDSSNINSDKDSKEYV